MKLSLKHETRQAIIEYLVELKISYEFGDGMEKEYVLNGFPCELGLLQMTDAELVSEFEDYEGDVDLLDRAHAELEAPWSDK